jgi:hypothetical protein
VLTPKRTRAPVGRSLQLWRASLLRGWQSTARALPWGPMPPFTRQHSVRKPRLSVRAGVALACTAPYNRSFDTDAQVLQCASRTRLPVAGQLRR